MDLARLKAETATEHTATEETMPLMSTSLTVEDYIQVLRRLYYVVRAWDDWSDAHVPADLLPLLQNRRRAPLLQADLDTLGWKTSEGSPAALRYAVQTMDDTAVPGDPRAVFLGRMYVMEGSTLGGQYIARHLEQQFRLPHGVGNSYFVGYGEQTGERWRQVREVLAALPDEDAETVIRSAKNMFELFGEAMRSELSIS